MNKKVKKILLTCLTFAFTMTVAAACSCNGGGNSGLTSSSSSVLESVSESVSGTESSTGDSSSSGIEDNATYTISQTEATVQLFDYLGLNVYRDDKKTSAEWESNNTAVATVDENGVVATCGIGQAVITATANSQTFTCTVKVVAPDKIPSFTLDVHDVTLRKNGERQITPIIELNGESLEIPADISYTSDNPSVEVIKNDDGTCIVKGKASCENVKVTVVCPWYELPLIDTVNVSVGSTDIIVLSQTSLNLDSPAGGSTNISGTLSVEKILSNNQPVSFTAADITWSIEDDSIATIDANGKVTSKKAGQTFACASWTNTNNEVQKVYCSVNVLMTTVDLRDQVIDISLFADNETKIRFAEYGVEIPQGVDVTVTDITNANNPFVIGSTFTGNTCELKKDELKSGQRTMEIRCGDLLTIYVRVDVVTRLISTADDFVSWVSDSAKIGETPADALGYTSWSYDGYVALANNIDLTGKTVETLLNTKDDTVGFQGVFDGRGYTVIGGTYGKGGIFGSLAKNAVFKNVAIRDATIYGQKTWDANGLYNAVVANHVSGTIENCVIDVKMEGGTYGWNMSMPFGREVSEATFNNVVLYTYRGQADGKYIHPNGYFAYSILTAEMTDVYMFCPSDTYLTDSERDNGNWNADWVGGPNVAASLGIVRYPYLASVSKQMQETLDGQYWQTFGEKAEFSSYATLNTRYEYLLNTGLDAEFNPVANTEDLVIDLGGLEGTVKYTLLGTDMSGEFEVSTDGEAVFSAEKLKTFVGGLYDLKLETPKKTSTVKLQLWSGYIDTADELVHWQAFTTKQAGGTATSWTYDGAVALKADINLDGKLIETDMNAEDKTKGYQGLFEGNNHTIKGGTYGVGGLFGTLGENGMVQNVAIVDAVVNAKAQTSTTAWNAVIAGNTFGTVNNSVIDLVIYGTAGNWKNASVFGKTINGATLQDLNVYVVKARTDWAQFMPNEYFASSIANTKIKNVSVYAGAASTDFTTLQNDGMWALTTPLKNTADAHAAAAKDNLALGITRYPYPGKDVAELPVSFDVLYELYSGLDSAFVRIENKDGVTFSLPGLNGETTVSNGTISETFTAQNGTATIPSSFFKQLGLGEHNFTVNSSVKYALKITVCTAILEDANDIIYFENYADKSNYGNYENSYGITNYEMYTYGGYFVLGNNIDLSGKEIKTELAIHENDAWERMDNKAGATYGFQGMFDGRGYTLKGGTYGAGGLFGAVGDNGVVKNFAITDAKVQRVVFNDTEWKIPATVLANYFSGTAENLLVSATCDNVSGGHYHAPMFVRVLEDATLKNIVLYYENRWYFPFAEYVLGVTDIKNVYIFSDFEMDDANRLSINGKFWDKAGQSDIEDDTENAAHKQACLNALKELKQYRYSSVVGGYESYYTTKNEETGVESRKVEITLDETYFNVKDGEKVTFKTK